MIASTLIRRIALAFLVVGAMVLGSAGIAHAAEELDVQQYDDCIHGVLQKAGHGPYEDNVAAALDRCCVEAGGRPKDNEYVYNCEAPPESANPNDTSAHPARPPRAITIPGETQINYFDLKKG